MSSARYIRWRLVGSSYRSPQFSRWHADVGIPADDEGQTACGWRYTRRRAEYADVTELDVTQICKNCQRALRSTLDASETGDPS